MEEHDDEPVAEFDDGWKFALRLFSGFNDLQGNASDRSRRGQALL